MDRTQRLNLSRIFANAFARRIAAAIVALALAWLGFGEAKAQTYTDCYTITLHSVYSECPDGPTAFQQGLAVAQNRVSYYGGTVITPPDRTCYTNSGVQWCRFEFPVTDAVGNIKQRPGRAYRVENQCLNGGTFDPLTGKCTAPCPAGQERHSVTDQCIEACSSRPNKVVAGLAGIPNGSVGCDGGSSGCEVMYSSNGDGSYTLTHIGGEGSHCSVVPNQCSNNGSGYTMNFGLGVCQPPIVECESNEVKDPVTGTCSQGCDVGMIMNSQGVCAPSENDCPAGNVRAPSGQCLPGEGQCAAGEARRANGTCGKDSDGDGQADEDDDNDENDPDKESASGGDSCNAPPSCSGGAIACMQVKIQWRIDCNTRKNVNISGGACNAVPVCQGEKCDALQYAQLLQQWRASCALEKLAQGEDGDGGQPEWTKVNGMNQDPGAGENADDQPRLHEKELSLSDLDGGGFGGGGGSCPALIAAGGSGAGMGGSFAQTLASPPAFWCDWVRAIYGCMALSGAIAACVIVTKGWG